ncbi:signal transduction histidine kinase [Candidatus Vecturithrix granuli]|uniref:histidine kinase n=1 Tax=Vecturithrix granuli TaxID=1499967 RepID=A0A081BXB0_VECG1|nr:signal transduction histidine kinase [Candidatus Vecturithrix granuli]
MIKILSNTFQTIRSRLFAGFIVLVIIFSILSAFIGVRLIRNRVVEEAQTRVLTDLESAWSLGRSELERIEVILRMTTGVQIIIDACSTMTWPDQAVQNRLEMLRLDFGLDFLGIVSPRGQVMVRGTPPYNTGDFRLSNPVILRALRGETLTSIELMSGEDLEREQAGLAEKAFLVLEETPHAKPTLKNEETRGMVLMGAMPIKQGAEIIGVVYGGFLLNRNFAKVDRIAEVVFQQKDPQSMAARGTVTIFLGDTRITTTVRDASGNRAIGTRVSREVADRVLENGQRWGDRAFVVNDWYLTAYDPIRNSQGEVIGMLYVGILERPYTQMVRGMIWRYVMLSLLGLAVAMVLAFFIAARIAEPLHRVSLAAQKLARGEKPEAVTFAHASHETTALMENFNKMVVTLFEREASLKEANEKLEETNRSLNSLNRAYMETVGFISHELKSPLATIMNYVYLLREQKLGAVTEKQTKALRNIDQSIRRVVEMVRNYLSLSRLEKGELQPVKTRVDVLREIVTPVLDSLEVVAQNQQMTFVNSVGPDIHIHADLSMIREVFENLIGNALKYGREGGVIKISAQPAEDVVRFRVFNEGDGIMSEKIDMLFQKFTRLEDDLAARKQRGTGLGLFITKHIISAHGGEIHVESKQGEWTEFIFTLPRDKES